MTGLFNKGPTLYPGTDPFTAGVNLALQLFLQSPHFLYRTELGTTVVNGVVPLSDYELASKLSYAIANTMPDDTLLAAADVVVLDESFAAMDPETLRLCLDFVWQRPETIITIAHP